MYSIDETIVSAKDCWPTPAKHCCYNTPNCVRAPHHVKKKKQQQHNDMVILIILSLVSITLPHGEPFNRGARVQHH